MPYGVPPDSGRLHCDSAVETRTPMRMTSRSGFAPKRGRPSAQQVKAIDRAILDAARRMVLESGYTALSMDAIAATLGISKGTLYSRHPSKEELLYAVVKDSLERWNAASSLTDPLLPTDLASRLRARLVEIGRTLSKPEVEAYYQLGASIRHRVPEVAALFYESGFMRGVEVIADDIRAAGDADGRRASDPNAAAANLLYTFLGWHKQESAVRVLDEAELVSFAGRAVDFFMLARPAW